MDIIILTATETGSQRSWVIFPGDTQLEKWLGTKSKLRIDWSTHALIRYCLQEADCITSDERGVEKAE